MSATMDVDLFSEYFNKSPVLYLEGRQHPIQIFYTKQTQSDYLQAALVTIFQIHQVSIYSFTVFLSLFAAANVNGSVFMCCCVPEY